MSRKNIGGIESISVPQKEISEIFAQAAIQCPLGLCITDSTGSTGNEGVAADVMQGQGSAGALNESEEKFRKLAETTSVAIVFLQHGKLIYVNPYTEKLTGYTTEELLSMDPFLLVREEFRKTMRDRAKLRLQGRHAPSNYEFPVLTKSGETKWIDASVAIIDVAGNPAIAAMGYDVTQKKRTEEALKSSEEKFRSIFENSGLAIFQSSINGKLLTANTALARMFGYDTPEEVIKSVKDINRDFFADPAQSAGIIDSVLKTPKITRAEVILTRKDGSTFTGSLIIRLARTRNQRPRLEGFVEDITAKKRAEVALRNSERRLSDIVSFLPDATFAIDKKSRIITWNRAMEDLTGMNALEMIGKGDFEYSIPFYGHRRPMLANLVLNPDPELEKEYTFVRVEGNSLISESIAECLNPDRRYIWSKASALYDSEGRIVGAIESIRDITKQRLEEQRKEDVEAHKREFYRRTISAATEGKLVIAEFAELKIFAGAAIETWPIERPEDIYLIRDGVKRIACGLGMNEGRVYDMVLCVGEAATNALKHAGGGSASIHRRADALVFVVEDHGSGIEALTLPDVALTKSYSTARSLGMGYKAMISIADRVHLATGPNGTTVAIEMILHPVQRPPILAGIPDTWSD